MIRHIFLDLHPLGALSHPKPEIAILRWLADCRLAGHTVYVPEVIDYEIRRELLRAGKFMGVRNLDALKTTLSFLPISSPSMLLAAQALTLGIPTSQIIVATSNVSHISRFVPAEL